MAAKKKPAGRPPAKKRTAGTGKKTSGRTSAAERERYASGRRQLWAVLRFAIAAFLLCVTLIKGQNVWLAIHNFLSLIHI